MHFFNHVTTGGQKWREDHSPRLYPTAEDVPKFYGLPKIHKNEVPLRPIVSSIGSITYEAAKDLAVVIVPLVGKTEHHIKNSTDFVQKIKDLEVPPYQKLVSFDVSTLFTSIPTDEAVRVIRQRLEQDNSWQDRTNLNVDQLTQLLELCLNTTYFMYSGDFYKQNKGPAMGSPISPIGANLYMEHFEKFALSTAPNPPDMTGIVMWMTRSLKCTLPTLIVSPNTSTALTLT